MPRHFSICPEERCPTLSHNVALCWRAALISGAQHLSWIVSHKIVTYKMREVVRRPLGLYIVHRQQSSPRLIMPRAMASSSSNRWTGPSHPLARERRTRMTRTWARHTTRDIGTDGEGPVPSSSSHKPLILHSRGSASMNSGYRYLYWIFKVLLLNILSQNYWLLQAVSDISCEGSLWEHLVGHCVFMTFGYCERRRLLSTITNASAFCWREPGGRK